MPAKCAFNLCGREFEPKRPTQKYCRPKCRFDARNALGGELLTILRKLPKDDVIRVVSFATDLALQRGVTL